MKVFNSRKDRLFKGIFYGTIIVDFIPLVMLFFIPLDESLCGLGINDWHSNFMFGNQYLAYMGSCFYALYHR